MFKLCTKCEKMKDHYIDQYWCKGCLRDYARQMRTNKKVEMKLSTDAELDEMARKYNKKHKIKDMDLTLLVTGLQRMGII